jgi:DNA invertase Pin-like site-specific DNA recombinase
MAVVGYARVSSLGQSLDVQREKLKGAGVEKLFEEKKSGVDDKRPQLKQCLDYLREGDTLVVTKIDRLARSASDFHGILKRLGEKCVGFKALDDADADTTTRSGKLLLGLLALIAEFETEIRKERQVEGIAKAKAKGTKFGRKLLVTPGKTEEVKAMRENGMTVPAIIEATGLSKASIYRALGKWELRDRLG